VHLTQQDFVKPQTAQLSPSGYEVNILPKQLEGVNNRPMGSRNGNGFPNPLYQPANPPISTKEQGSLIQEEVKVLLEKGAIVPVHSCRPQKSFYSTLFLVPKKGGQMRPVINLKRLNE